MIKAILLIILLVINLFAIQDIKPTTSYKASGAVQSIIYKNQFLYAGTSNGTVEIFNTNTNKKIQTITLPKIKDFMGDLIAAKVYSIDLINNKLLIVSQGMKGYRNLWVYEQEKLKKVIDINKKFYMQKASFINDSKILFALLSNQIGVYDLAKNKVDLLIQVSHSSFSHFQISEDKSSVATTDESGIVRILRTKDLTILEQPKAINLDRVYQLDYKKDKVLTAGQDRKAALYENFNSSSLSFDFLLYSCALSPSTNLGAIAYNEDNEILVFDTKTKKYLYNLVGHDATLTQILFINDKELFSSSDSQTIFYWKLN